MKAFLYDLNETFLTFCCHRQTQENDIKKKQKTFDGLEGWSIAFQLINL